MPFANGVADYWTLVNERDGGINGVKIVFEECETGYATDKGVECYERLKGKGPTGAGYFSPLSTGITFALTEKVPGDKIPHADHGLRPLREPRRLRVHVELHRCSAATGRRPTSPSSTSPRRLGGFDKLKGKKISLVYHDSPYGKEPIPALRGARQEARLRVQGRSPSRIRASSRSRSGSRSARTGPTTCCCGAGA